MSQVEHQHSPFSPAPLTRPCRNRQVLLAIGCQSFVRRTSSHCPLPDLFHVASMVVHGGQNIFQLRSQHLKRMSQLLEVLIQPFSSPYVCRSVVSIKFQHRPPFRTGISHRTWSTSNHVPSGVTTVVCVLALSEAMAMLSPTKDAQISPTSTFLGQDVGQKVKSGLGITFSNVLELSMSGTLQSRCNQQMLRFHLLRIWSPLETTETPNSSNLHYIQLFVSHFIQHYQKNLLFLCQVLW